MKFNTKVVHGEATDGDKIYNSVVPPIFQTSTYKLTSPDKNAEYTYSRTSNPSRKTLEDALATLENASFGIAFSSGVAAIDAVLKLLKTGDEVIASKDIYGGSYRIFNTIYQNFGIKFHYVDMDNEDNIIDHINHNTRLIWLETPTNPVLKIFDITAVAALSKQNDIWLAVDNTFASPYLQNPLNLGADIVMHSASKYINGHSDVILGALMTNDAEIAKRLKHIQNSTGAIPGPMDCFLTLRGIKTLHVRMQCHCNNAKAIANYLVAHSKVEKVLWPGFSTHKNHLVAQKQMKDFGGVVSLILKNHTLEQTLSVIRKLKLFTLAESLGGIESLVGHPAGMSHASMPKAEREKNGIPDALIRLSVGIEDVEDLITDLESALA